MGKREQSTIFWSLAVFFAALLFLVEKLEARGHQIKAGDIVITGAMSELLPAEPGTYEINYGEFGTIGFEIVA